MRSNYGRENADLVHWPEIDRVVRVPLPSPIAPRACKRGPVDSTPPIQDEHQQNKDYAPGAPPCQYPDA